MAETFRKYIKYACEKEKKERKETKGRECVVFEFLLLKDIISGFIVLECRPYRLSLASTESQDKMERGLLLDVVVGKSTSILQLLSSKDESLLIGGNAFLILDLSLNIVDRVRWLHLKSDGLASESLDKDLHSTTKSED